ncbi:MAG: aminotransferase class V-fold PLP-dependent enzyme [Clostridia bacterium]|nr:aminotransferase class V-fold PLP-dependent enzyme [Clostridia bacterium]
MRTPIADFVRDYAERDAVRLHMPGHKGRGPLGVEKYDITEISGADSLFSASGIIRQSENCAGELFGADTFYSTEGSSLAIRAMLYLASVHGGRKIVAARGVHKSFVSAVALIGLECSFIYTEGESYLSSPVSPSDVERAISDAGEVSAVYLTSPDYLGNMQDIRGIAEVCHRHGALLLVDNAHGAYLNFLPEPCHPIRLGADMCADSAHKTLPVLTGGAYLHISKNAPSELSALAPDALSLFASTSPSYLILASLDLANRYISEGYTERLALAVRRASRLRSALADMGFNPLAGGEPLKVTLRPGGLGYRGDELLSRLSEQNIECEMGEPDFLVMMISADTSEEDIERTLAAFSRIEKRAPRGLGAPALVRPEVALDIRSALTSPSESIPTESALGRVSARLIGSCPPAVPIVMPGEIVDGRVISALLYYGIENISVIK